VKRFVGSLAGGVAASLLVASGCLLSTAAVSRPAEHMALPDWNKTPVEDRDLGHGVHMLESFGGNIGVLAGDEGVLLVDAEWPQLHDKVVAAVAKISPKPIRYLVNTHWHWDHVGGDGLFGKAGVVITGTHLKTATVTVKTTIAVPQQQPETVPTRSTDLRG